MRSGDRVWANWCATVPHGLPEHMHRLGQGDAGYLSFLGRISPEKRVDRAVEGLNAYRGALLEGTRYAEAFAVVRGSGS